MTVAQASTAIPVTPTLSRNSRSRIPSDVTSSVRKLYKPARPPANASRKSDPRISPWINVQVSRDVSSIHLPPRFRGSSRGWALGHLVARPVRSEEHTSELQSRVDLVCRLLLEKKKEEVCPYFFINKKNRD